ncbi:hypothetical protein C0J52_24002 [Blattella germanica]|nr:hypothetical protein C0J52_24002 [Blattella germanica]
MKAVILVFLLVFCFLVAAAPEEVNIREKRSKWCTLEDCKTYCISIGRGHGNCDIGFCTCKT